MFDPWAYKHEVKNDFGITLIDNPVFDKYQSIILAVGHKEFKNIDFVKLINKGVVIFDTKGLIPAKYSDGRL